MRGKLTLRDLGTSARDAFFIATKIDSNLQLRGFKLRPWQENRRRFAAEYSLGSTEYACPISDYPVSDYAAQNNRSEAWVRKSITILNPRKGEFRVVDFVFPERNSSPGPEMILPKDLQAQFIERAKNKKKWGSAKKTQKWLAENGVDVALSTVYSYRAKLVGTKPHKKRRRVLRANKVLDHRFFKEPDSVVRRRNRQSRKRLPVSSER